MALNFLGAAGNPSGAKYFDVRLDNDYVFFRGSDIEAASCQLQGSLVLCLTEPLTVKHIKLTLSGIQRMSWLTTSTSSMSGRRTTSKDCRFYEKTWTFRDPGKNKTETLKPDNYEFPFDVILEGSLPESVEGLGDTWIMYRFKAEIGRKFAKDIVVRKPLRLIRTPDSSALELSHAMSVENTWTNKIEYSISTPTKAIIFGTSVQVDFRLVPLLKGLVMGRVTTYIKEEHEFVVDPDVFGPSSYNGVQKSERTIALDEYDIDGESDMQILDEQAEGFTFSRFLELPKSLNKALQDCNVNGIKIRHKIKFNVQLHNPDGHVSELRANLPLSFYISPSLPINSDNDLIDQSPHAGRLALENDLTHSAPPLYGQHQYDQLYSGFDSNGYRTPGNFSSPGTPYSSSRNISSENLASLDAISSGSGPSTPGGHHISPAALQTRLQDLRVSGPTVGSPLVVEERGSGHIPSASEDMWRRHSSGHGPDYFAPDNPLIPSSHRALLRTLSSDQVSPSEGDTLSRPPSGDDQHQSGTHTPHPSYYHYEDLARVPSYSTAVRASAPRTWGSGSDLPSYVTATNLRHSSLTEPASVHVRDSRGPPRRVS